MSKSKEEALTAGVEIAATQHNMKRRKFCHDYRRPGTYMLTLVVEGRRPLLGRLVTVPAAAPVPAAAAAGSTAVSAYVELSALGRAIRDEEVPAVADHHPEVEVWRCCIMPDHIHLIVHVRELLPEGQHLGQVVAGFKGGCSRAWWRLNPCATAQGTGAAAPAPSSAAPATAPTAAPAPTVGAAAVTVPAAAAAGKKPLFEPGYNDRLLLEEGQLGNWHRYLADNPRRLALKRLHPDLFVTTHYADIGEWHCQTVGNRFLLDVPQKAAVIVHRAYTDVDFADYRRRWLACGEAGGILVSAAIAPREKAVMREAMDRGYRVILVRENGFPPLYKPAGEAFDACSEGRLLQVSPWDYHMERRTISREQCLKLNRLVEYITAWVPAP